MKPKNYCINTRSITVKEGFMYSQLNALSPHFQILRKKHLQSILGNLTKAFDSMTQKIIVETLHNYGTRSAKVRLMILPEGQVAIWLY